MVGNLTESQMEDSRSNSGTEIRAVAVGDRLYSLPNTISAFPKLSALPSGGKVLLLCLAVAGAGTWFMDLVYRLMIALDVAGLGRIARVFFAIAVLVFIAGYFLLFMKRFGVGMRKKAPFRTPPESLSEPDALIQVSSDGLSSGVMTGTLRIEANRIKFVSPLTVMDINKRDVATCVVEYGALRIRLRSQPQGLQSVSVVLRLPCNKETKRRLLFYRDVIRALPETAAPSVIPAPWPPVYMGTLRHAFANLLLAAATGICFTPMVTTILKIREQDNPLWLTALVCAGYGVGLVGLFSVAPILIERQLARKLHKLGFPLPQEPKR